MAEAGTKTHITQLGTVVIPVGDQDRAVEFYVETLGFEKRADAPFGNGDRWIEVAPAGTRTSFALMPPREGESTGIDTRAMLLCDDADAEHARLRERGVDVDAEVMRMGEPVPPMFFIRDPDGNKLGIVEAD
jgi:predicted enzyme related to lactoylglutathione lyase